MNKIIEILSQGANLTNEFLAEHNVAYTLTWQSFAAAIGMAMLLLVLGLNILGNVRLKGMTFVITILVFTIICVFLLSYVGTQMSL